MGRRVRIFHISDLHARSSNHPIAKQAERATREAAFRERVIGAEWDKNLAEVRKDGVVDMVAFTGVLGDWGHET